MAGSDDQLKSTQLRELYDALAALKEQEQTALAELHAEDPQRLIGRFVKSVETVAAYPDLGDQPFHGLRPPVNHTERGLDSTVGFAARLARDHEYEVDGAPQLSFSYRDRELFPLRSAEEGGPRPARRTIDLLLASSDGLPIVGELKIGADRPTYYALVQALMYAAELSSSSQLQRLARHCGTTIEEAGPSIGIYLIGFRVPEGRYRSRSFDATKTIAEKLIADPRVGSVLSTIAYLEAESDQEEALSFRSLFAFGDRSRS